jgi:hypothetical protein
MAKTLTEAERFCRNLRASVGKWKMDEETYDFYLDRLSKRHHPHEQWCRALSKIIADNVKGEVLPLAQVFEYLDAAEILQRKSTGLGWMSFDLDGKRCSVRIISKDNAWVFAPCITHDRENREEILQRHPWEPAVPPSGATNIRFTADEPAREYDAISAEEGGRQWFRQGWSESGADPAKADAMFTAIEQEKAHTLLDISDFDDSPNALGMSPALEALEREIDGL